MEIKAFNKKENCLVHWMGITKTVEEMEDRLRAFKSPDYIIPVEVRNNNTKVIYRSFMENGDRYVFDFDVCKGKDWKQYDTEQDAWYFGVWVNLKERKIVTYAEGDVSIVWLLTDDAMKQELKEAEEFYGPPPPAFTAIDLEERTITKYYDERPTMN